VTAVSEAPCSGAASSLACSLGALAGSEQLRAHVQPGFYRQVLARAGVECCHVDSREDPLFGETQQPDLLRQDLRLRKALDRVVSEVKPISTELAQAREKLWTPEQEPRK